MTRELVRLCDNPYCDCHEETNPEPSDDHDPPMTPGEAINLLILCTQFGTDWIHAKGLAEAIAVAGDHVKRLPADERGLS